MCPGKFVHRCVRWSRSSLQTIPAEIAPPHLVGAWHIFQEIPFQAQADVGGVPGLVQSGGNRSNRAVPHIPVVRIFVVP